MDFVFMAAQSTVPVFMPYSAAASAPQSGESMAPSSPSSMNLTQGQHRWALSPRAEKTFSFQIGPGATDSDLFLPPQQRLPGSTLSEVIASDPFWCNFCESHPRQPPPFSGAFKPSDPDLGLMFEPSWSLIDSDPVLIHRLLFLPDPSHNRPPCTRLQSEEKHYRRRSANFGDSGYFWLKGHSGPWTFSEMADPPDAEVWLKEQPCPWALKVLAEAQETLVDSKFAPGMIYICRCFISPDYYWWSSWYWYQELIQGVGADGVDGDADHSENGKRRCGVGSSLTTGDPNALD